MARSLKGWLLTWGGRLLMILGLIFVASRLWSYRHSIGEQLHNPWLLLATLLFAFIYAISGLLLALGWWLILHSGGQSRDQIRWRTAWPIYGKTQIAKYIPGNIFHFAGRHVLASREGITHSRLVAAATLEVVMLLLAAELISLLAVGNLVDAMRHLGFHAPLAVLGGGFLAGLIALFYLSRRFAARELLARVRWRLLFMAQLCYLLFFLVSAGLFFMLISLETGGASVAHWQLITGSYAFAWGIGFVVPGAPAGLGLREAVLIGILSGVLPENAVLLSSVLFRLVTTLGDNLFFLKAIILGKRSAIGSA